ncbi:hypothetical protein [Streptomyces sp. NPDC101237]|uniref:hypothetical protein n=1 Tax=Streptomyces sp. NPDC101237 TaxID=3366139 RepID=UPI003830033C
MFTGYEGGSYKAATRLASSAWADHDLVSVQDVTGDNVADLLYRTNLSDRLLLRTGKAATSGGGVDLQRHQGPWPPQPRQLSWPSRCDEGLR